jgi:hypothetical protein
MRTPEIMANPGAARAMRHCWFGDLPRKTLYSGERRLDTAVYGLPCAPR